MGWGQTYALAAKVQAATTPSKLNLRPMTIPAQYLPRSWEMPLGARVLDESASVVAREFDGQTLDWLVALI